MKRLVVALIILLSIPAAGFATDRFVTQSGSGLANGTTGNPWSVASYNASSAPTGGDTVFFSGTITSTVKPNSSGTGNGASRLVLDFTGATLTTAGNRIDLTNGPDFITLLGGTFSTAAQNNIYCNNVVTHDITVSGWTFTGVAAGTGALTANCRWNNALIEGNTLDNAIYGYCDSTACHDITLRNNYIRSSVNVTDETDVFKLGDAYNVLVEGNWLINRSPGNLASCPMMDCHNDVIQTFESGATPHARPFNWTVRYNRIEQTSTDGSGGNMSWMMMEGFTGIPALKIYANLFIGTGTSWSGGNGIVDSFTSGSTSTHYFYNNTIIRKVSPINHLRLGIVSISDPGTLYFRNNVDYLAGDDPVEINFTVGATWNRNFFSSHLTGCSSTYSGANGSCSLTTAAFTDYAGDNYYPAVGSVLLGAGDNTIGSEFNQGIASGATWPNPTLVTRSTWDAGAYNQGSASCIPAKLLYSSQPTGAVLGASLGTVSVGVYDSGDVLCTDNNSVSITLSKNGSATWGTLASASSLTKTVTSGVATWTDLSITTTAGSGSIDANDGGALTDTTSNSITISSAAFVGASRGRMRRF